MDDQRLIDLFFARAEQAIAELDRAYGRLCRRLSGQILPDPRDVEEYTPKTIAESNAEFRSSGTQYVLELEDISDSELQFALSTPRTGSSRSNYRFLWIPAVLGGGVGYVLWYLIRRKRT